MKKLLICLLLLPLLFVSSTTARANSGPTYMYRDPGLEMAVDAGCPVAVKDENLTFDFSGGDRGDWSPIAEVTASYTMTNPTDKGVSVTMAFPFVTSLSSLTPGVSSVSVDGEPAAFDVYYGKALDYEEDLSGLSLSDVLSNVLLESPEEPEDGMLYTVTADTSALPPGTEQIVVRMRFPAQDKICYIDGFNGVSTFDDGAVEISAWINLNGVNSPLTVFVPGGSLKDDSLSAYASYDSDKPLDNVSFGVSEESISFREYIASCRPSGAIDERHYWALLQDMRGNRSTGMYGGVIPMIELLSSVEYVRRLAMAVYTVDFKEGETKNVTVTYPLEGTMRRPSGYSTKNATYTYTYLSNPAKEWASFGTLSLTVIPPADLPLFSSAPELIPDNSGSFTAKLNGLPESNITFTLGTPPSEASPSMYLVLPLLLIAALIAAAAATIVLIVRHTRKKKTYV